MTRGADTISKQMINFINGHGIEMAGNNQQ